MEQKRPFTQGRRGKIRGHLLGREKAIYSEEKGEEKRQFTRKPRGKRRDHKKEEKRPFTRK